MLGIFNNIIEQWNLSLTETMLIDQTGAEVFHSDNIRQVLTDWRSSMFVVKHKPLMTEANPQLLLSSPSVDVSSSDNFATLYGMHIPLS